MNRILLVSLTLMFAACNTTADEPATSSTPASGIVDGKADSFADDNDVIESRPEVAEAERHIDEERSQRARMVRGHVRLSRLGVLLCDICLD